MDFRTIYVCNSRDCTRNCAGLVHRRGVEGAGYNILSAKGLSSHRFFVFSSLVPQLEIPHALQKISDTIIAFIIYGPAGGVLLQSSPLTTLTMSTMSGTCNLKRSNFTTRGLNSYISCQSALYHSVTALQTLYNLMLSKNSPAVVFPAHCCLHQP